MTNKKPKIIGKNTRISNPFDVSSHKTERTASAILMHWMRQIIENQDLNLGFPDIETGGGDHRFPDTVIYKTQRSKDIICVFEFKQPFWDPFREEDPKEPARKKATNRHAQYFVTSNFRELILWNTEKVNASKPEEEQIVNHYHLSEIYDLDLIEENRYKASIVSALERFLKDLYELSTGAKAEPRLAIDELLIWRLQEKIHKLAYYYENLVYNEAHKDKNFAKSLAKWFNEQGWNFYIENTDDYQKISRQTAYLLVNKILFYNALQLKRPDKLAPLEIPKGLFRGSQLQKHLKNFFDDVLEIDYETVYTTDFIDDIAFQDSREVVEEIKELVTVLRRYDFSTLGFDIIGRIFERLIPENERHNLGQYFTDPDVVDLILQFCVRHENDKVFDPACGAGTFLVRAYQLKKLMNQRLPHEEILDSLWGNDIAKFPAHLTTINLAINDLSSEKNYPRVIQKDFFDLLSSSEEGFRLPEDVRKVLLKTMDKEELKVIHPHRFNAVVGNPPYTRQEEISEISSEESYKEKLIKKALTYGAQKLASISKRAGIYAYFFIHGAKFLKNGGRFGFIVSNAWLDAEYGAGLQEFFFKNYKIIAIIESKVEKWFKDADINTCIVILEKCNQKKERDENTVRFVSLLKPLRHFIPPAQTIWEKQIKRKKAIGELIKTILAHNEFYQNDELRIFPKNQSELYEEGFDQDEQKYIGSKWGKYISAPEIFFKILEKGKNKLVPLKKIASIETYLNTGGADGFFIVKPISQQDGIVTIQNVSAEGRTNKTFKIEKDYLVKFIKSPRELSKITIEEKDAQWFLVLLDSNKEKLNKKSLLVDYIKWAESKDFHNRSGCKKRNPWWTLPGQAKNPGIILWSRLHDDTHIAYYNPLGIANTNFYSIWPKNVNAKVLTAVLNSTLIALVKEFSGRVNFGQGVLKTEGVDLGKFIMIEASLLTINERKILKVFESFAHREICNIFEELGSSSPEGVSLDKVKPDRRELDKIVMSDILGLTEEEQLDVYRSVIDLVKSRIDRAKSGGSRKKTKSGIDIDSIVNMIIEKIGDKKIAKWYRERILNCKDLQIKKLPEVEGISQIEKSLFGWQIKNGKKAIECHSRDEARYLKVWLEIGSKSIKIPKDEKYLISVAKELENLKSEIDDIIESYLGSILDQKLKSQILHQIWQRLTEGVES